MASDRAFLLPVVIDNLTESDARVPDRFRELQWRHQAAHLLELRALTSLVRATQDPKRSAELLPRVAALLEQLTLRYDSADDCEARLLVPGPQGNPTATA